MSLDWPRAYHWFNRRGYEYWRDGRGGKQVAVHQLLAISEGVSPHKIFSGKKYHVHHKNGFPFDNRPGNVEVVSAREHMDLHDENTGESWRDANALRHLHHDEGLSTRQIADKLDCGRTTVRRWMEKHGIERRSKSDAAKERGVGGWGGGMNDA